MPLPAVTLKFPIVYAGIRNGNGRIYPKALLEKVARETIPERVWVYSASEPDGQLSMAAIGGCLRSLKVENNALMAEVQFARNDAGM